MNASDFALYPTCRYVKPDGNRCGSPALTGSRLCWHHLGGGNLPKEKAEPRRLLNAPIKFVYPSGYEAIQHNHFLVMQAFSEGRIDNVAALTYTRMLRACDLNFRHWQDAMKSMDYNDADERMDPIPDETPESTNPAPETTDAVPETTTEATETAAQTLETTTQAPETIAPDAAENRNVSNSQGDAKPAVEQSASSLPNEAASSKPDEISEPSYVELSPEEIQIPPELLRWEQFIRYPRNEQERQYYSSLRRRPAPEQTTPPTNTP